MRAMHLVLENFTVVDTVQMQSQGNVHSVWGLRVWSKSMWMEPMQMCTGPVVMSILPEVLVLKL